MNKENEPIDLHLGNSCELKLENLSFCNRFATNPVRSSLVYTWKLSCNLESIMSGRLPSKVLGVQFLFPTKPIPSSIWPDDGAMPAGGVDPAVLDN